MVKIENDFGDVLTGKCSNAIYQKHYGRQIRRKGYKETKEPSPQQIKQRNKFKDAIAWVKTLTTEQRIGLKNYYETSRLGYEKNMPVNWYNFAKYCYIKNPTFELLDPINNSYKITHPAILKITELASDNSVLYEVDNLTIFEDGILLDHFYRIPDTITSFIKVTLITGLYFIFAVTPALEESKYFDSRFFDSRFFE